MGRDLGGGGTSQGAVVMSRLRTRLRATARPIAKLALDYPFVRLGDQEAAMAIEQRIPPVLHQTWEEARFSYRHADGLRRFRAVNPDLSFRLFDRERRDRYMTERWGGHDIFTVYANALFGAIKADVFRYCILFDRGGYYFDISKACRKPLTTFHGRDCRALISFESHDIPQSSSSVGPISLLYPSKYVLQWGLGFEAGHPLLKMAIARIVESYPSVRNVAFEKPFEAVLGFTGPRMFTSVVHDYFEAWGGDGIRQAGIDFESEGIFSLRGSEARYRRVPSYTAARAGPICT